MVPGAAIPKLRRPNKFRVIYNSSITLFHYSNSAIDNGRDGRLPVSTIADAALPSFIAFEWLYIEQVQELLEILSVVSIEVKPLVRGLTLDIAFWFRMVATAQKEYRNGLLFFLGAFQIDRRAQMGLVASAHSGQRLSVLLTSLASNPALGLSRSALYRKEIHSAIARCLYDRAAVTNLLQGLPLIFQSFQDDMLQVAVGHQAESIIDEVERHKLQEKLGIELIQKNRKPADHSRSR